MAHVELAVLNDHELDLNTTMMYRHEDYLDAIRLVEEEKILLAPLQSHCLRPAASSYSFSRTSRSI